MNAPLSAAARSAHDVAASIDAACQRIAPSWPLDRLIAVNPHWGWVDQPITEAAAAVGVLGGARLLRNVEARRQPLLADLAGWRDTVVHQISQHCAAHFDAGQARWHAPADPGLYAGWRERVAADRGLAWPQGRHAARATLAGVPTGTAAAVAHVLDRLAVPAAGHTACLTAWLLDLNGWAAACAWPRWQARLHGGDDPQLADLLAIRAVWDLLLAETLDASAVRDWNEAWAAMPATLEAERARQVTGWQRLEAEERALQQQWMRSMQRPAPAVAATTPAVQAVFCIDVRSEVFRRALEAADDGIATRGFAGFFGLPVDHRPLGTAWRQPQLPGLLTPAWTIDERAAERSLGETLAARRRARLDAGAAWEGWRGVPASSLGFVEACGPLYAGALLRDSLPAGDAAASASTWQTAGLKPTEAAAVRPRLAVDAEAGADLACGVLGAMSLTEGFAPLLLLCGHAGQTANNPHAAGLDCGACGGQSGEVNARALAGLLNDPAVRAALRRRGIDLSASTHVLAGVHLTTTDDVLLLDTEDVPAALAPELERLRQALRLAGDAARAERAPALGLPPMPPADLATALRQRARHWAETRPEWALAGNAGFIAAPRQRTRGVDLGGRCFLHDYEHRADAGYGVLTLILSAPMVVAHWINLQYLASSVDPDRHGAGNKLLHNVVGGGIGVFEGNGGDLRIGLPWQSVHDGERLQHEPLRLSVFVQAPTDAIDGVLAAQTVVRHLVNHGWVQLLAIDDADLPGFRRRQPGGGWEDATC